MNFLEMQHVFGHFLLMSQNHNACIIMIINSYNCKQFEKTFTGSVYMDNIDL